MKGIIWKIREDDNIVDVKFAQDIVVSFPKKLFNGKDFFKVGKRIVYEIRRGKQEFMLDEEEIENPYRQEILDELSKI